MCVLVYSVDTYASVQCKYVRIYASVQCGCVNSCHLLPLHITFRLHFGSTTTQTWKGE